jgi:glycosyltransferase involved in cell wall biosynthesis
MVYHLKIKKLRIGIVTRWFWPFIGGPAIHVYELVNWLAQKGHEVHLLIPPEEYLGLKKKNSLSLPCVVHYIRYPEIKDFFKIGYIDNWTYYFKIAFRNAQYIRNLKLDILHGHTPNFSYLTNILGKMINVPTIITLHFSVRLGLSIDEKCFLYCQSMDLDKCLNCSNSGISNIKEKIWNIGIKKIFIQSTNRIITTSKLIKNNLIKHYKFMNNISCVPNWVDLQRFKFTKDDPDLLNKFKINKKEKIILYCGHIFERKGIEYLIQAMPEISRNINDCKLLITGELNSKDPFHTKIGELINQLRLENNIIFVGYFGYKDMPKLYSIADLFILPSLEEAQPLVLLEAMAARVPIVTTSLDPIKEVIKDGENGILVKPRNSEEISKAAIRILKDNKLIQRLVQKGYKTVKQKFSKDKVIPKILKIYKQEIGKYFQKP